MAAVQRAQGLTPSPTRQDGRDHSLAAPVQRAVSKGGISSSATSVASSDGHGDAASDLQPSGDATADRLRSRASEDAISDTSSHRRRMSKLFKGRRSRRRKSVQDDTSQPDSNEDVPPLPDTADIRARADAAKFPSEESLALHKSVASSLLTEDSDAES